MKSPSLSFRTTSRRGAAPRAVEVAVIRAPEPRDTEGVSLVAQGPAYLSLPRLGRTGNVSVTDYTRAGEAGVAGPWPGPGRLPGRRELPRGGRRTRSEERRVGKECRSRWVPYHEKQKRRS